MLDLITAEPAADLRVATLAARVHMSPRHFARVFREKTGTTPARHVARVRVEAARGLLEEGQATHGEIARRCGFSSAEALRQAFVRELGVPPARYRPTAALRHEMVTV